MTITIRLKTGNAAFTAEDADPGDRYAQDGAREREITRILREWINHEGPADATLHDYNGNRVGSVTVTGK